MDDKISWLGGWASQWRPPHGSEVELATEKLNSHKPPSIDQMPAELIKGGGKTIRCEIHKFIISVWNKEELPEEWKSRSL